MEALILPPNAYFKIRGVVCLILGHYHIFPNSCSSSFFQKVLFLCVSCRACSIFSGYPALLSSALSSIKHLAPASVSPSPDQVLSSAWEMKCLTYFQLLSFTSEACFPSLLFHPVFFLVLFYALFTVYLLTARTTMISLFLLKSLL